MRISKELVAGLVLTIISVYYWGEGYNKKILLADVPLFYQYTYRLTRYLDIVLTAVGMFLFYRGLNKLRR